jgi:hypothetical protein
LEYRVAEAHVVSFMFLLFCLNSWKRSGHIVGGGKEVGVFVAIFLINCFFLAQIAREQDIKEQIGGEIFFDLVDHDKVKSIRVSKTITFADFKKEVRLTHFIPPWTLAVDCIVICLFGKAVVWMVAALDMTGR